jgi:hypothetical protein
VPDVEDPICDEKLVRRFNGRLSQIARCYIFLFLKSYRSCSHSESYIFRMELRYRHQLTEFLFSDVSEPPCVIQLIGNLSISDVPDTRIAKEFGIFSESTLVKNFQSIAKEN